MHVSLAFSLFSDILPLRTRVRSNSNPTHTMTTLYADVETPLGRIAARFNPDDNSIFAAIGDYCSISFDAQTSIDEWVFENRAHTGYSIDHPHCGITFNWFYHQIPSILLALFGPK
jgi:hypothetical protein